MANWSRVWSSQCSPCNKTDTDSFNFRGPDDISKNKPNVLDGLPSSISSLSAAVDYFADEIRKLTEIHRFVIVGTSESSFTVTFKRHRKDDITLELAFSSTNGTLPVHASMTGGYSNYMYNMGHLVDWVVDKI